VTEEDDDGDVMVAVLLHQQPLIASSAHPVDMRDTTRLSCGRSTIMMPGGETSTT
jgi:hypothetical protein